MADVWISARAGGDKLAVAEGDYLPGWSGNWTAHLELANLVTAPSGQVLVSWLGRELVGQVVRSGQTKAGRSFVLVAGGSGHLGQANPPKLTAKGYQNCPLFQVLQELARDAGETLSVSIAPEILRRTVASWPRKQGLASACLDDLARSQGLLWRVLQDGTLWLGVPSFVEATLAQQLQLLDDQDPSQSTALYAAMAFGPLPGDTYEGRKISDAHYIITASGDGHPGPGAFVRLWWLDAASTELDGGRLIKDFSDLVRQCVPIDWLASYPARVVSQASDGTLEVVFDSKLLPPRKRVPYRALVDGAKLVIDAGARCVVHFDNGRPELPIVDLFDHGNASRGVARHNDTVDCGTLVFSTVANGVLTGTYTPPGELGIPFSLGATITLKGKISSSSSKVFLP